MTEEQTTKPEYRGPLYAQVAQVIRSEIAIGRFGIGTILPSELDMAQTFNVSVGTMRKALGLLADDKMIRRSRGRGTEVIAAQPPTRRSVFKYNPEEHCSDDVDVLDVQASVAIANQLAVARDEDIKMLVRVIVFDDKSRALDRIYLPDQIYQEVQHVDLYSNQQLEEAYQRLDPTEKLLSKERVSTDIAEAQLAEVLKVPEGMQVLKVARLLSLGDTPIEYSERFLNLEGVAYSLSLRTQDQ